MQSVLFSAENSAVFIAKNSQRSAGGGPGEDSALYDNEIWNDPRDFAKPVKEISLPQDAPSTSDHRLIELENQVQRLTEAHLAPKSSVQVNKIASSCEICSGLHDTQYYMENLEQAFFDYASSRTDKVGGKQFTTNQGPRNLNEANNASKDKPDFNWARTQTFTSPHNGSFSTYSSSYQTRVERVLSDFDSRHEKRLSRDSMAHMNAVSVDHLEKDASQSKGIKSPSKLLSQKYQSQSSLEEQNRNPFAPKHVHFVNSIVLLRKEDEPKEEEVMKPNAAKGDDHSITVRIEEEFKEESEELEEETEGETEEEENDDPEYFDTFPTIEELSYHEWLLKNPRPPYKNGESG
ncbi:hypothetical protein Tco_1217847 [Tanacetum coccineum]